MPIETEIGGATCYVKVTHYNPGRPAKLYGEPEDCHPEVPEEIEYELCDVDGNELDLEPTVGEVARIENLVRDEMEDGE